MHMSVHSMHLYLHLSVGTLCAGGAGAVHICTRVLCRAGA
jgi:hypothetical protein